MNTPPLLAGEQIVRPDPVSATDVDPEALDAFLAHHGNPLERRVGRYFEQLVHFWLAHVRRVAVEGVGVQLRDGKRTVGEIDFLYRDAAGLLVHLETAVKFFLHHPRPGTSHLPGPNPLDTFEKKTRRLFEHQLPISRGFVADVARREALVAGMIFYHLDAEPAGELPERLAPDHLRGRWLRSGELDRLVEVGERRGGTIGATVGKPHWMAPRHDAVLDDLDGLTAQLRVHFGRGRGHPVMVSLRDGETLVEIERLFVVSDHWPAKAN